MACSGGVSLQSHSFWFSVKQKHRDAKILMSQAPQEITKSINEERQTFTQLRNIDPEV